MGTPKAALEWHGSTLLRRVVGVVGRSLDGPVVVVRAPEQELPELPDGVEVVEDAREGRGPLQGLAAGLAAVRERAHAAYASSTDVPLLHPRFISAQSKLHRRLKASDPPIMTATATPAAVTRTMTREMQATSGYVPFS